MTPYVKITYAVMTEFDRDVWSEPFQSSGLMDENPDHEHLYSAEGECTWPGCPVHRMNMGELGPHPFSSGFRSEESTRDTVARAEEYVRSLGSGSVWVERITETITRERLPR